MKNENDALRLWLVKHPQYHPALILRPGIWRILTGPIRVLPDFIIIGAGKCGTTSLYNYLIQHPNTYPSKFKELNYFVRRWTKWYRPNFPTIFLKYYVNKFRKQPFITGESSPFYLLNPFVAKQVKKKIPNVKIIILLRNPVDRTFSQYNQWQKTKLESLSFEDAIKSEKIKTKEEWKNYTDDKSTLSRNHVRYSYLEGGLYYDQIKVWLDVFPKEQFLFIKAEDFFSDPSKILSQVFDFLGVQQYEIDFTKKYDVGFQWDLYSSPTFSKNNHSPLRGGIEFEKMNPDTKQFLQNFFKPHNEKLYHLLGRNFHWDD